MEPEMMIQEYTNGPREAGDGPTYKLWTYEEAMEVQSKNNWWVLAVVLALAGALSGYLLRNLYFGVFNPKAVVAGHNWIANTANADQFMVLMIAVGTALGVFLAYLFRNKYANSNFAWSWFSSALVLPLGTYALAPIVWWVVVVSIGLVILAVAVAVIWFIWKLFS